MTRRLRCRRSINCAISAILQSVSGAVGDLPLEQITLSFQTVELQSSSSDTTVDRFNLATNAAL